MVLVAHPDIATSRINRALSNAASGIPNVLVRELYREYPNFRIDAGKEQALLLKADLLVLQFPFYWYHGPALLKEWMDKVLTYGFAYGSKGNALAGKSLMLAISTGGPEESYNSAGRNHYTMEELLRPFERTAALTKMVYLKPFLVQGVRGISDEELSKRREEYKKVLSEWKRIQ